LVSPNDRDIASVIRRGLYNGFKRMGILQGLDGSATMPASIDDGIRMLFINSTNQAYKNQSAVACALDGDQCTAIEYTFIVGDEYDITTSTAFDLGLPSLPLRLQSDGSLSLRFPWQLRLTIGYHTKDGIYVRFNNVAKAVTFGIIAETTSLSSTGQLFVVEVTANQNDRIVRINGGLDVIPLQERMTMSDVRLTGWAQLFQLRAYGAANINLDMNLHLTDMKGFPTIGAVLQVQWSMNGNITSPTIAGIGTSQLIGTSPTVALRNVTMDVSSFLGGVVKPVVDQVASGLFHPSIPSISSFMV
jgi:hypothetical protein